MQMTLEIPDTLAAQLAATGREPALAALDALEDWATREALRQAREDIAARRTVPLIEEFARFREKHGVAR